MVIWYKTGEFYFLFVNVRNRGRVHWLGFGLEVRGIVVDSTQVQNISVSSEAFRWTLGHNQFPIQCVTGFSLFSQAVKCLGYEADHLRPSSVEVKKGCNYISTPLFAFMASRGTTLLYSFVSGAGIEQSVWRLATGWKIRGSNPGGGEIFRTRPDRPWGPPSLLYNEYRVSFPGVKRPGRGVDRPPPFRVEVKERIELYLYSPSGPSWPVMGWTLLYFTPAYHSCYSSKGTGTKQSSNKPNFAPIPFGFAQFYDGPLARSLHAIRKAMWPTD